MKKSCMEQVTSEGKRECLITELGIWLVIDGVGSIIFYHKQTLKEHLIRVIRAGAGVTLIALCFWN